MAWTAPMTAVANTAFSAAQFNTHVRDNLLETAPGKATAGVANGSIPVKSATNQVTYRTPVIAAVATSQSTSSTSYVNLATSGPAVTVDTGANAIVLWHCSISNNSANSSYMSVAVSGATTIAADDDKGLRFREQGGDGSTVVHLGTNFMWTTLTPGSNTFTAKYRAFGGTATYFNRRLIVIPL